MNCPSCNQITITFLHWCRSPNAFLWRCPHCGVALKAGASTWWWFIGILPLVFAIVAMVIYFENHDLIPKTYARPLIFLGVLSMLPYIYLAFRCGNYVSRPTNKS